MKTGFKIIDDVWCPTKTASGGSMATGGGVGSEWKKIKLDSDDESGDIKYKHIDGSFITIAVNHSGGKVCYDVNWRIKLSSDWERESFKSQEEAISFAKNYMKEYSSKKSSGGSMATGGEVDKKTNEENER